MGDAIYHRFISLLRDETETALLARRTAPLLRTGDLIVLSGELGAGKTFFVRELAYARGLPTWERVTSPTFSLVHEIELSVPLFHADLYRLADPEEVVELGLDTERDRGIVLAEWAAPFADELGGDPIVFEFFVDPRSVTVHGPAQRAQAIVQQLMAGRGQGPSWEENQ